MTLQRVGNVGAPNRLRTGGDAWHEAPAFRPAITVTCVARSEWQSAGGGYVILRKLLSDVAGLPVAELMGDAVLLPRV